ncbi:hypothetical protein SALBM311S_09968 [Streptomyces alboniger]
MVQATRSGVHRRRAHRSCSTVDQRVQPRPPGQQPRPLRLLRERASTPPSPATTATRATQYDQQSDRTDQDVRPMRGSRPAANATDGSATSFISVDQARANLDKEVPDRQTFDATVARTRAAWADSRPGRHRRRDIRPTGHLLHRHPAVPLRDVPVRPRYAPARTTTRCTRESATPDTRCGTPSAQNAFLNTLERFDDTAPGGTNLAWSKPVETHLQMVPRRSTGASPPRTRSTATLRPWPSRPERRRGAYGWTWAPPPPWDAWWSTPRCDRRAGGRSRSRRARPAAHAAAADRASRSPHPPRSGCHRSTPDSRSTGCPRSDTASHSPGS